MASKNRRSGLGKGLDSLFVDNTRPEEPAMTMRLSEIEPNADQPRKDFNEAALAELADSIRQHGVLQPLLVRPMLDGSYQLVAGERRWRAARMAGLTEVPVVIRELTDAEAMELALIENLQREDLNPIEEALGYQCLLEQFHMTQERVAATVGKSRPVVANALRLLRLPEPVVQLVRQGELSSGHARALLALEDGEEAICQLAERICRDSLTVREVERLTRRKPAAQKEPAFVRDPFYEEMQAALEQELGRKVKVIHRGERGSLTIEFFSKEELRDMAYRLAGE